MQSNVRPLTVSRQATIAGAKFHSRSMFRPTAMSLALSAAGIIPGTHLVSEKPTTGLLRHKNDSDNSYKSVQVAL